MTVEQPIWTLEREATKPANLREWLIAAVCGLADLRFHRTLTQALLPVVYVWGLVASVAAPVVLTVVLWRYWIVAGLLFLVLAAVPLAIVVASVIRLLLEFFVHTAQLARQVRQIAELSTGLHGALTEVSVPMTQLSKDLRAVQFWRLGRR